MPCWCIDMCRDSEWLSPSLTMLRCYRESYTTLDTQQILSLECSLLNATELFDWTVSIKHPHLTALACQDRNHIPHTIEECDCMNCVPQRQCHFNPSVPDEPHPDPPF